VGEDLDKPVIDSLTRITQASLLQLRWLSLLAMAMAALVSPLLLGPSDLLHRLLLFTLVVGVVNLGFMFAARSLGGTEEVPLLLSPLVQLTFELLAWGAYIYLSGGVTNPMISLLLPLVAIGALLLSERQAWFLALGAILIYSFLWYFHVPLTFANYQIASTLHLFGMWLVFALSAVMVVWFVLRLTQAIRRRDQALLEAREQAIRDDWLISLGSQAAGAAHELGTPLATLNILADDLLEDDRLALALRPDIQLMKAQIQGCKRILNQLADRAGRARDGQQEILPVPAWLQRTLAAWRSLNPHIDLTLTFGDDLDACLLSVDNTLERALINLLDNALQAGASRIQVHAEAKAGNLALSVADNGVGLSSEALKAFHQGQPMASQAGMGVGLLLGRAAIERQGGRLGFQWPCPTGTLAQLSLPLAPGPG
jgi:two-component system, sensor histidine kinase RegB